jgi:hypothetical protein
MTAMENKWQPIETAPKNGQYILLADYSGYAFLGEDGMWIASGYWLPEHDPARMGAEGHWTDGVEFLYTPSHWQPLPEPPQLTAQS